jgi:hypothetical protein
MIAGLNARSRDREIFTAIRRSDHIRFSKAFGIEKILPTILLLPCAAFKFIPVTGNKKNAIEQPDLGALPEAPSRLFCLESIGADDAREPYNGPYKTWADAHV